MDRCPQCHKRMKPVIGANGRTDFQCVRCDAIDASPDKDMIKRQQQPLPSKAA